MNTLITKSGKVVATVSDKHNVTVTEKDIVIELFTTTKTKTKFDLVKKPRRGRPAGVKNKKRLTKSTQA
jgi:hypothetical protein|tara:strand:+ start:1015 stop:1221 length:207 start_codon:yes stop_codon:yes gene_type:complete